MKSRAPERLSLQLTPISLPLPAWLSEKRSSAGASCAQDPHQLAQKVTSTGPATAPRCDPGSATGGPASRWCGRAGAGRPEAGECGEASPNTAAAGRAAATTVQT